jgi:tetrahydromethanopterin S-methyltransferase subunit G
VCWLYVTSQGRGGDFNNVHRRLDELNSEIERHVLDTENLLLGLRQIQQEQGAVMYT